MNEPLTKEEQFPALPAELRRAAQIITSGYWSGVLLTAADCIEQLQMPPAKVRELAECDEGADNLALLRALCKQIDGQRKHIATLEAKLKRAEKTIDDLNDRFIEENL